MEGKAKARQRDAVNCLCDVHVMGSYAHVSCHPLLPWRQSRAHNRAALNWHVHRHGRQADPSPSKPIPHPNAFLMGVLTIWEPPSKLTRMGILDQGPVHSHRSSCRTSVFSDHPQGRGGKRHLIGPASFRLPRSAPLLTVAPVSVASGTLCLAQSTGRGQSSA